MLKYCLVRAVDKSKYAALALLALTMGMLLPVSINYIYHRLSESRGMIPVITPPIITRPSNGSQPGGPFLQVFTGLRGFNTYEDLVNFISAAKSVEREVVELLGASSIYTYVSSPFLATPIAVESLIARGAVRTSITNVQVVGVDELDYVKNTGEIIAVSSSNFIYIVSAVERKVVSVIDLGNVYCKGLFLNGDKLIAVFEEAVSLSISLEDKCNCIATPTESPITTVSVYNLSNLTNPVLLLNTSITGSVVSARMTGPRVYLVTTMPIELNTSTTLKVAVPLIDRKPMPPQNIKGIDHEPRVYTNILALDIDSLEYSAYSFLTGPSSWMYMTPKSLYLAVSKSLTTYEAYVKAINSLINYLPNDVSTEALNALALGDLSKCFEVILKYFNTLKYDDVVKIINSVNEELHGESFGDETLFYVFNVSGINVTYIGDFRVEGHILDQFSMEEMSEYFIVATTSVNSTVQITSTYVKALNVDSGSEVTAVVCTRGVCTTETVRIYGESSKVEQQNYYWLHVYTTPIGESINNVFILNLSNLSIVSSIKGLAPGERIYSARLLKNVFYLVTFRQVDPLYAIDLSNPENPKVLGYLKIPGFSEYLHPISSNRLLGIGIESGELKISLFDISDPRAMSSISEVKIPNGYSPVLYDHHAFTLDPDYESMYLPIQWYGSMYSGVLVVSYSNDMLRVRGLLRHSEASRAIYIGDEIYTISRSLIKIFNAVTLNEVGSIPLALFS